MKTRSGRSGLEPAEWRPAELAETRQEPDSPQPAWTDLGLKRERLDEPDLGSAPMAASAGESASIGIEENPGPAPASADDGTFEDSGLVGRTRESEEIRQTTAATATSPELGNAAPIVAADALQGAKVVDRTGHEIGQVRHLMIDMQAGRVTYAVLALRDDARAKGTLCPVPWSALRPQPATGRFIVNVDSAETCARIGFDEDRWPSMSDPQWIERVRAHYGVA